MKFEITKREKAEFRPFTLKLDAENLKDAQKLIQLFAINKEDSKIMEELKYQLECMGYNVEQMYKL